MDLRERGKTAGIRHPWEQARIATLGDILKHAGITRVANLLDVGCGDGYAATQLRQRLVVDRFVGCDTALSDEEIKAYANGLFPGKLVRDLAELGDERFDLVLLLDVLEHVCDDETFLAQLGRDTLAPQGTLLLTVPAFMGLFSSHDRFLGHYRRYDRTRLRAVVLSAGFVIEGEGYLFGSLLPARALGRSIEALRKWCGQSVGLQNEGVGNWSHSQWITNIIARGLYFDNRLLLALAKRRLWLPGLSLWMHCKKLS